MPAVRDFRGHGFDQVRLDAAGKNIGRRVYWRLYAIENLVRVVIHSVLTVQSPAGAKWWTVAVDPDLSRKVEKRMRDYAKTPWYSQPGRHEVYYTFLPDLVKIMTANSHLFEPIMQDIDEWIARLELIRVPRNI